MTYEVKVSLKKNEVLPDMFDWLEERKQKHLIDWRWFKPEPLSNKMYYTFQFEDAKIANWFAIRWSE